MLGAIFGALLYTALIPSLTIGAGPGSPGCFGPAPGVTLGDAFGWETTMTFLLVMTVYATAVASVSLQGEGGEEGGGRRPASKGMV